MDAIPVSSIKGAIGHPLGAAGAIESIASIKAIETGIIPATLHCDSRVELAPLDVVPNVSRKGNVKTVLSNSFGTALIWQAP